MQLTVKIQDNEIKDQSVVDAVGIIIKEENIDLTNTVSGNTKQRWAVKLKCSYNAVNVAINTWRTRTGKYPYAIGWFNEIKKPIRTKLHALCLENNFIRSAPIHEHIASQKICDVIKGMPPGGKGLFIGTQTAFSACETMQYPMLCDDNLMVAHALLFSTDQPGAIVIGNLVDPPKALLKGQDWRSLNSLSKFKIYIGPVTAWSFEDRVESLAIQQARIGKIAKVVLMTSGMWSYCASSQDKYKKILGKYVDLNFEKPSIRLTKKYDNLHIVTMAKGYGDFYSYRVLYLHNGITEEF